MLKCFLFCFAVSTVVTPRNSFSCDHESEAQAKSQGIEIELTLAEGYIGVKRFSQPFKSGKQVPAGLGSIDGETGWSYQELRELGGGIHTVAKRRVGVPLQGGPNQTLQVSNEYAKDYFGNLEKKLNVQVSFYDAEKSLLVTWEYAEDCYTSTLVQPVGRNSVDHRLTGWTYGELITLGAGKHKIESRRIFELLDGSILDVVK